MKTWGLLTALVLIGVGSASLTWDLSQPDSERVALQHLEETSPDELQANSANQEKNAVLEQVQYSSPFFEFVPTLPRQDLPNGTDHEPNDVLVQIEIQRTQRALATLQEYLVGLDRAEESFQKRLRQYGLDRAGCPLKTGRRFELLRREALARIQQGRERGADLQSQRTNVTRSD